MKDQLQKQCDDILEMLHKKNEENQAGSRVMRFSNAPDLGGQELYDELLQSMADHKRGGRCIYTPSEPIRQVSAWKWIA